MKSSFKLLAVGAAVALTALSGTTAQATPLAAAQPAPVVVAAPPAGACAPETGVTVVVNFAPTSEDLEVRCVLGAQDTYESALEAAGFTLETYAFGFGDALCKIDDVGSNQEECSTFSGALSWVNWINVEGGAASGTFTSQWQAAVTGIGGGSLAVDTYIGFSQTTGAAWPGAGPQTDLPTGNETVDPPVYGAAQGSALAAAGWIGRQVQDGDGLLNGSVGFTTDAIYALAAAGVGKDVIDQAAQKIWTSGSAYVGTTEQRAAKSGAIAKTALALQIAGLDPTEYPAGETTRDLIADLREIQNANGTFGTSANPYPFAQALPILTLARTVAGVPDTATSWLISQQCADESSPQFGSFYGYYFEGAPPICESGDADSTAMSIQALLAAGVSADDPTITAAQNWLISTQAADGGVSSNTNSTGLAGQVFLALGDTDEAAAAAGYVGGLQFSCDTVNLDPSAITAENVGAISYDTAGFTDAREFGIDDSNLGTIQYATVQAVFGLGTPDFGSITAAGAQAGLPSVPDCTPVVPDPVVFTLDATSGTPGTVIPFAGGGFDAGETVTLTLNSTPIALGEVTADETGNIVGTFTVPAAAEVGDHTVVVAGLTSGLGATAAFEVLAAAGATTPVASTPVTSELSPSASPTVSPTVTAVPHKPGHLAATGTSSTTVPLLATGVLLLLVGSALLLMVRNRRSGQL